MFTDTGTVLSKWCTVCAVRKKEREIDTEDAEPKPKKHKTDKSEGGKSKNSGFLAPIPISEALAGFLGAVDGKVSRADAVKRLWDYIKENNLQVVSSFLVTIFPCFLASFYLCDI